MWTDITTSKTIHILQFSYTSDIAIEDNTGSYSLELILHLHCTYILFYSLIHFNVFLNPSVEWGGGLHFLQFIQIHILDNCCSKFDGSMASSLSSM